MRKKNQILEYYVPSSKGLIKTIYEQSINEKPFNLIKTKEKN